MFHCTHMLGVLVRGAASTLWFCDCCPWLDVIMDKLVQILKLFGILLKIPSTVLGLTVLAFGISIQDLVAKFTLSKKVVYHGNNGMFCWADIQLVHRTWPWLLSIDENHRQGCHTISPRGFYSLLSTADWLYLWGW